MELYEKILSKEEINRRFIKAVTAIMVNKLISSKTGLAESLGVKPAKFSEILNSRMNVGIDMIARMCDYYDVSPDWLLLSRGNNVFRRMDKQAIWIDDDNLNMKYTENSMSDSKNSEEPTMGVTPNTTPISPVEESIIYKMYKEKEAKIEELNAKMLSMSEEIGRMKAQLSQYQPENQIHQPEAGDLEGKASAKNVSTKKHSSPDADNATSATAQ